jgi:transcriptional regulator with XRE-family HTH domain
MSRKKSRYLEYDLSTIGGRIAFIRSKHGENQIVFSEKTGISKATISEIENNKYDPSFSAIVRIVEVYHVDPMWLITGASNDLKIEESAVNDSTTSYPQDISVPNIIDISHAELVKEFQQKDLAKECNSIMIELERIDPMELEEVKSFLEWRRQKRSEPKKSTNWDGIDRRKKAVR